MRLLVTAGVRQRTADLGLSPRDRESVDWALKSSHGLVLATGPTGSGKSTTLYTMINVLNAPDVNIMTVEDPVEREIAGVTQVAARPALGMTFDAILRGFLRQDPDIMLVGEIRDLETADMAVKASITGHLVLSSLHTNGAPAAVGRLANMGVPPYLLASSLRLVVAQRLVRLLCPCCRRRTAAPEEDLQMLAETERERVAHSFIAEGCSACSGAGFKGRMALFEIMPVRSLRMRAKILSSEGAAAIATAARDEGMRTLRDAAIDAVAAGATSLSEALQIVAAD
jgi:type IV pilus assembly protein PilB